MRLDDRGFLLFELPLLPIKFRVVLVDLGFFRRRDVGQAGRAF